MVGVMSYSTTMRALVSVYLKRKEISVHLKG